MRTQKEQGGARLWNEGWMNNGGYKSIGLDVGLLDGGSDIGAGREVWTKKKSGKKERTQAANKIMKNQNKNSSND